MQKMGEVLPSALDILVLHFDPGNEGFIEKLFLGITVKISDLCKQKFGLSLDLKTMFLLFLEKFAMTTVFECAT